MAIFAPNNGTVADLEEAFQDANTISYDKLQPPTLLGLIAFPVCFFVAAILAIYWTAEGSNIAPIWLANAIVVVVLLRNRPSYWAVFLLLAVAADLTANLVMGSKFTSAFAVSIIDLSEQLIVASCMRRFASRRPWFISIEWMVYFGTICVVAAATAAILGAGILALLGEVDFATTWRLWFIADALGLLITIPFLLTWTERRLRMNIIRIEFLEIAAWVLADGLVAVIVFSSEGWPQPFVIFPFLLLTAVRTGLLGATVASALVGAIALGLTIGGAGPIASIADLSSVQKIQYTQVFVLITVLSSMLVAARVVYGQLLEMKLRQQSSISAAALENMSQGLAMFDGNGTLVSCNSKYAAIYQLPPELITPGTHRDDINAHIQTLGEYDDDQSQHFKQQSPSATDPSWLSELVHHRSGTIIQILRHALPVGGWVAT